MMVKKYLSVINSFLLAVVLLSGCGDSSVNNFKKKESVFDVDKSSSSAVGTENNETPYDSGNNDTAWKKAYAELLRSGDYNSDTVTYEYFSLCYVDDNDIPELILLRSESGSSRQLRPSMYTYYNDDLVHVSASIGTSVMEFYYKERTGEMLFQSSGNVAFYKQSIFLDGEATVIHEWGGWGYGPSPYDIDGEKFYGTSEEFHEKVAAWQEGYTIDNGQYEITEENIKKVFEDTALKPADRNNEDKREKPDSTADNENSFKTDSQKDSQFQINGISFEEENVEIHLSDDNYEGCISMCPTLDISGGGAWDGIDIKWSSEDGCVRFESEVTSYGEDCRMYCNTPGSHVITAATPNGLTAKCTITVYGAGSVNNNYLDVEEVNTSVGDIFKVTWYLSDDHSTRAIAGTRFDTEGIIIEYDYTNDNIDGFYRMEYSFLAKSSGEVTIYFDEGSGIPLSCKVYVSNPAGDIGDINGDGEVNLSDLLALRRHLAVESGQSDNEEWRLTDDQLVRADVYMDGGINDFDVLKLRRYLAAQSNDDIAHNHPGWLKLGNITDDDMSDEDVDVDITV